VVFLGRELHDSLRRLLECHSRRAASPARSPGAAHAGTRFSPRSSPQRGGRNGGRGFGRAHQTLENLRAGEGIRTLDVHLGWISARDFIGESERRRIDSRHRVSRVVRPRLAQVVMEVVIETWALEAGPPAGLDATRRSDGPSRSTQGSRKRFAARLKAQEAFRVVELAPSLECARPA
jgi:hypothetical protein